MPASYTKRYPQRMLRSYSLLVAPLLLSCVMLSGCFVLVPFIEPDEQATCHRCRVTEATTQSPLRQKKHSQSSVDKTARLIAQLASSREVDRTHAAFWLGETGSASALTPLVNLLQSDRSKWVRRACVKALAKLGDPRALDPLMRATKDKDPFVASSARSAYSALTRTSARASLKHTSRSL